MSLRPYESYKESAAERLGLIPVHWDVKPLKRVGDVFPSNVDKKAYEGETLVRLCNYTDVWSFYIFHLECFWRLTRHTPQKQVGLPIVC